MVGDAVVGGKRKKGKTRVVASFARVPSRFKFDFRLHFRAPVNAFSIPNQTSMHAHKENISFEKIKNCDWIENTDRWFGR